MGREGVISAKKEENVDFDMEYLVHDSMPASENVQCSMAYKSAMMCPQQARGAVALRIRALFPGHSWKQGAMS